MEEKNNLVTDLMQWKLVSCYDRRSVRTTWLGGRRAVWALGRYLSLIPKVLGVLLEFVESHKYACKLRVLVKQKHYIVSGFLREPAANPIASHASFSFREKPRRPSAVPRGPSLALQSRIPTTSGRLGTTPGFLSI